MLLKDKNHKFLYFPNMAEGSAELMLFGRTTVVMEGGYAKSFMQLPSHNYQYTSKGYYVKLGLDFDISHPDERAEITLGWRFGVNNYTESALLSFASDYYGERYMEQATKNKKQFMWGELLLTHKFCLYHNEKNDHKIYFAVTLKLKTSNWLPAYPYPSLAIPGYGFYKKYIPAVSFSLFYQLPFKRNLMRDLKLKRRYQHRFFEPY